MNMFARFDENPAITQDIKETKRYGRVHGQRENSIPSTNKVCGGYKNRVGRFSTPIFFTCLNFIEVGGDEKLRIYKKYLVWP